VDLVDGVDAADGQLLPRGPLRSKSATHLQERILGQPTASDTAQ
jgi:hypothetical protein